MFPDAESSTEALLASAPLPAQPSERRAWLLASVIALAGIAVLVAVLSGVVGRTGGGGQAPPAVLARVTTPEASPSASASALQSLTNGAGSGSTSSSSSSGDAAIVAHPTAAQQSVEQRRLAGATEVHISRRWMEGFYPIYSTAQSTFGVNWLLIASIHMQESAFSTAPGTYHGLNFAHCCGGPMQFNVTNGGGSGHRSYPSTWNLVSDSYTYGRRPASYDHMTVKHPSIYDDFDAIMGAAHLLSADGAGYTLDGSAWAAAYDYYGHDQTGVSYADEVLARAIGWSQHGFCINCGVQTALVEAVHAAYGAPVAATLEAEEGAAARRTAGQAKHRRSGGSH